MHWQCYCYYCCCFRHLRDLLGAGKVVHRNLNGKLFLLEVTELLTALPYSTRILKEIQAIGNAYLCYFLDFNQAY